MVRLLAVFFVLVLLACAGEASRVAERSLETPVSGKHFFWKVSDENSSVWLLGSIHFADSSFYPLDSVIENAFEQSEELAVELNVNDDEVRSQIAEKSMEQGLLPHGQTLSQVLPRSLWNTLDSLCSAWNFPVTMLTGMKPWMAATTLSVVAIQRTGIDPSMGVDVVLLERAELSGKAIVSLETVDEQIDALADDEGSDSSGIYYMKKTLQEISKLDSMVSQMIRAWKTGDEELLREVLNESDDAGDSTMQKKMEEKIYTLRNVKMAENVAEFLERDQNVFVVVGVAHFVREGDNVIDLLRKKGFKVERY